MLHTPVRRAGYRSTHRHQVANGVNGAPAIRPVYRLQARGDGLTKGSGRGMAVRDAGQSG